METTEVDGQRIAFTRSGSGPALVLLHGYVADGLTTWRPQVRALADRFTVVAWDAPGVGGSADPPEHLGMAGYADLLAGFVASLGLERPHVAGLSFGGALAIELARRHPDVPRSLVLASAYAGWGGSLPAEVCARRLHQAHTLAGGVPTLLLYSDQDERAPLPVARHLHSAIAGSELVVLRGAGHVCNIESPDAFNAAVRHFLDEKHGGTAPGSPLPPRAVPP